jgi:hypothetical protein
MPIVAFDGGGIMDAILGRQVVQLMPLEVVFLFSIMFIVIGFVRGVRAEAWSTVFILVSFTVLALAGDTLIVWSNRIYKLSRFALAGGIVAEDPVTIWQQFADDPPLIETDFEKILFRMTLFMGFFLLGFILGRIRVRRSLVPVSVQLIRQLPDLGERLLGAILGGMNGFLIAYFVLPIVVPVDRETIIVVPENQAIAEAMAQNLANVAFVIIVIVILLGLMASGGIRGRG